MSATPRGTLFLLPVPLGPSTPERVLPADTLALLRRLRHFVVENAKTARAILKSIDHPTPLREIEMMELSEHTPSGVVADFLQVLNAGHDLGLMSEAGCPAVADPGNILVELAHRHGYTVAPMTGPSSILLALMASGMNGQRFAFQGYLPAKENERMLALRSLEAESRKERSVQIFIETPYRNRAMLDGLLQLAPKTRVCVACDLTLNSEWIRSSSVADWKKHPSDIDLDRRPTIFLLQA